MDIERAINDDRAVSPVIGVILMVAITVILAAVIGTFVLGMSDQMGDTSPRASFDIGTGANTASATITHETGATISSDNLVVSSTVNFYDSSGDGNADSSSATWTDIDGASNDVSSGSSVTITASDFSGETIRVIYNHPDSDSSSTLQKKEIS